MKKPANLTAAAAQRYMREWMNLWAVKKTGEDETHLYFSARDYVNERQHSEYRWEKVAVDYWNCYKREDDGWQWTDAKQNFPA